MIKRSIRTIFSTKLNGQDGIGPIITERLLKNRDGAIPRRFRGESLQFHKKESRLHTYLRCGRLTIFGTEPRISASHISLDIFNAI